MKHALIVAGLGRCGSSLTMQMLHAAGVPCLGVWPAFEGDECGRLSFAGITGADWRALSGRAVKVLDVPGVLHASPLPVRVVWLSRDRRQQAKSQAKLVSSATPGLQIGRAQRRRLADAIARDETTALRRWSAVDPHLSVLTYELLIGEPEVAAIRLCQAGGFAFTHDDVARMAACVRKSDADCAPDLRMELNLLRLPAPLARASA